MKKTARQFGRWVRNAALLARTYVGLVVVSVWLAFPLMGGQERGNRPNADKKQADSTAPVKEQAQALQVLEADQATLTLKGHTDLVTSVAFSPDGKRLASAGIDHTVKVWNATPKNGRPLADAGPPAREDLGDRSHAVYLRRTFHRSFRDNFASCFLNGSLMPGSIAALIILVVKGCARLTSLSGVSARLL